MRVAVETNIQYKQFAGIMNGGQHVVRPPGGVHRPVHQGHQRRCGQGGAEGREEAARGCRKGRCAATHAAQIEEMRSAMLAMEASFAEERAAKNNAV